MVFARTNPDPSVGHRGISAFLVEADTPGFSVGKPMEKMGLHASHTTTLHFEDCRIPASQLLGKEGEGFKIAMATLDGGRIGIAAQAVGIAQAALEDAIKYAKERTAFGKPIAEYQAIAVQARRHGDRARRRAAADLHAPRAPRTRACGHTKEAAMAKLFASRDGACGHR